MTPPQTASSRSRARPRWTTSSARRSRQEPPTADPAGPGLGVVVFGLASAIAWGAGDFGGGWTGRRAPVFGVAIVVDIVGAAIMAVVAIVVGERLPGTTTLLLAAVAGVFAVAGIIGLYQGLAVGRMGVVAPVTGLIAAIVPVSVGFVRLGLPPPEVLAGIAAALGAVVLVSRSTDPAGRPSGIQYALVGGVGLGIFNVAIAAFPEHLVAWPLVIIKLAALVGVGVIVVAARRPWRVPSSVLPAAALVGVLDLAGNGLYVLATQAGRIDVAATLSSLYPVTTVILAVVLLREHVSRSHLLGIVMAAVAIALIAGGSAAVAT
jgi:drug/metabolite transporter (DMT)-like permease